MIALLAGILLSRPLSRPIAILRNAALEVAQGGLGKQVKADAGGEIGELSEAFNHMSLALAANQEELESQRREIEAFNQELQVRVEERTRDLREAQKDLIRTGQLAAVAEVGAGLAHELNNPLAGILGLAQVLKAKAGESGDGALLGQIEVQATRCRDVVDTMLKLSANTVGEAVRTKVSLRAVLADVMSLSEVSFRQRGVTLSCEPCDEELNAHVPIEQTARILNQVLQSMKAGLPSGASLKLTAAPAGAEVEILIAPSQVVAAGESRDDWMASGAALWVARQMLDKIHGRMEQPDKGELNWRIFLPGAES